ncbi:MAG: iron-containing alcohol dehydrogenase, partial [Lachnospiraceae bacterium]|nr:iron-containing alcohol dehydrogenase [Lachnospiraceae bacterium]
YVAGMGFSNVGLGIDHAMAHTLSAYYNMPHGKACATLLPTVMEYNADATGEKYREIARAMGVANVDSMSQDEYRKAACDAVKQLASDVGIECSLKGIVPEADLDSLTSDALKDACAPGNPKDATFDDVKKMFQSLM